MPSTYMGENIVTRINRETGKLEPYLNKSVRRVSDMKDFFVDKDAVEKAIEDSNPVVYEVFAVPTSSEIGYLSYATTVIYPGTVGKEYFMTKGHYHEDKNASEVYICLDGDGRIIMQNLLGDVIVAKFEKDYVVFVPPSYAHRTVNVGNMPLKFIAIYPSNAGHDYSSILNTGFKKLVIKEGGQPQVIDNPNYKTPI